MVGISGVVGARDGPSDRVAEALVHRDAEVQTRYADDRFGFAGSFHRLLAGDQPMEVDGGDALLWVWGDVYGEGPTDDYSPREGPPDGSARYCAERYEAEGMEFVTHLNGDFAAVVYDRDAGTVSFATNRVASKPIFYARATDGSLVFASNVQALVRHPRIEVGFEKPYLYEYLQLRRVLGVKTPIAGVEEMQPAAVTTVDADDFDAGVGRGGVRTADGVPADATAVERYWSPTYRPVDEPASRYVDRLADTVRRVIGEWTRPDLDYGLFLSGGSDSRFVQAAMDVPVETFHVTDWRSRETRIAERVAETAGDEFHMLERGGDYDDHLLSRTPELSNFSGWFDQAYFDGFADEISAEADVLVSGLYADMLFAGGPLRKRSLDLGPLGKLSLPVQDPIESLDEYVAHQTTEAVEPLPYAPDAPHIDAVVRDNLRLEDDGSVVSHGVRFESLTDLVMYGDYFPMGGDTDALFSRSLARTLPYRTPFLDNRVIDLHREVPIRHFFRCNLVNRALDRIAPELAAIPHATTGVPLEYPFPVEFVGGNLNAFRWKHFGEEDPPEPYYDHRPWPDRRALLRVKEFAPKTLAAREDRLEALPVVDRDGAFECYRDHCEGEDNMTALYSLLTLLEMPVVEQFGKADPEGRTADDGRRKSYAADGSGGAE